MENTTVSSEHKFRKNSTNLTLLMFDNIFHNRIITIEVYHQNLIIVAEKFLVIKPCSPYALVISNLLRSFKKRPWVEHR